MFVFRAVVAAVDRRRNINIVLAELDDLDDFVDLLDAVDLVVAYFVLFKIHGDDGPGGRHAWCMDAAQAIIDGTELPPAGRGTAFGMRSTAESRAETIGRLLAGTTR